VGNINIYDIFADVCLPKQHAVAQAMARVAASGSSFGLLSQRHILRRAQASGERLHLLSPCNMRMLLLALMFRVDVRRRERPSQVRPMRGL
jgi:hypothetical protein